MRITQLTLQINTKTKLTSFGLSLLAVMGTSQCFAVGVGPFVPPARTATPVSVPVTAPVQVQAPVQLQAAPAQNTTAPLTLPGFIGNPVLTPNDQNQGYTGNSLTNQMGARLTPGGSAALPPFIQKLATTSSTTLTVEELPTNATIIDTGDANDSDHLVPIGFYQGLTQVPPLFGAVTNAGPLVIRVTDKRTEFFVCTDEGRLIQNEYAGGKDGVIVGGSGTVFSSANSILTMHAGRALIQTGSSVTRIATKVAGVKIGPNSTVLVDYSTDKVLTVAVLAEKEPGAVKVRSSHDPESVIALNKGDELIAGDTPLGNTRDGESLARNHVIKSSLQASDVAPALTELTSPSLIGNKASRRLVGATSAYLNVASPKGNAADNHAKPALRLFTCDGSAFSASKSGEIHVYYGHVFLSVPQDMLVTTNIGDVACQSGSTVSISRLPGIARVQLFDTPSNAKVVCGKTIALIDKGQEVLLSDHYPAQSEALPADGTGRRQFVLHPMDNNITAVVCDFQVFGSIRNSAHLAPLRHPTNSSDRDLCTNLLKFTAAMQFATSDRGNFYYPPKQTVGSAE